MGFSNQEEKLEKVYKQKAGIHLIYEREECFSDVSPLLLAGCKVNINLRPIRCVPKHVLMFNMAKPRSYIPSKKAWTHGVIK